MKLNEEQKQKICDYIDKSLNSARLKYHKTDDEDSLPLVDLLSTGETILEGQEEIENEDCKCGEGKMWVKAN